MWALLPLLILLYTVAVEATPIDIKRATTAKQSKTQKAKSTAKAKPVTTTKTVKTSTNTKSRPSKPIVGTTQYCNTHQHEKVCQKKGSMPLKFIITIVVCIVIFILLCVLVVWLYRRWKAKREARKGEKYAPMQEAEREVVEEDEAVVEQKSMHDIDTAYNPYNPNPTTTYSDSAEAHRYG